MGLRSIEQEQLSQIKWPFPVQPNAISEPTVKGVSFYMELYGTVWRILCSLTILQSCGELDPKEGCQQADAWEAPGRERNQAETSAAQVKVTNSARNEVGSKGGLKTLCGPPLFRIWPLGLGEKVSAKDFELSWDFSSESGWKVNIRKWWGH